ncbi:MAG: outer membrane lipoprotein carrier protein LolA [Pyrinomonadaceae bacterium]
MDMHNKALQSMQADIKMVKYNPQLNVSDTYSGLTKYVPKSSKQKMLMRLDWQQPAVEQISVIGDNYELYKPSIKTVYWGSVGKTQTSASAGGALSFMNMSKEQLKANYDVVYLGEELIAGSTRTWHLQLTPLRPTSYKSAELWVDVDGMPRQGRIVEKNDDTTTILLSNIKKNLTLSASIFKLTYGSVKRLKG